jgi:hypothetical protein
MKKSSKLKWIAGLGLCAALVATGSPQVKQLIKIVGVGAAIKQFGPDINKALNGLVKHKDSEKAWTKVVPIISAGISSRQAIGAAQVMGPKAAVSKVQAVAQLDQDLFGREIKIRAMVPVDSMNPTDINRVEGVGVSGIVDLKL